MFDFEKRICINNLLKISDDIGDASVIGLHCPTGDISDCNDGDLTEEVCQCKDRWIFSDDNSQKCGQLCDYPHERKKRELDESPWVKWTKFYRFTLFL